MKTHICVNNKMGYLEKEKVVPVDRLLIFRSTGIPVTYKYRILGDSHTETTEITKNEYERLKGILTEND